VFVFVGATGAISGSASTSSWGRAIQVPGTANKQGIGVVSSVSCPAAGTCAVVGQFAYGNTALAFVVNEKKGTWGNAMKVRGIGNGLADATSVSCPTAGNCAAGGWHSSDHRQVFVVDEKNGSWGEAINVPGVDSLSSGGSADLNSVSCATPGNCVAGGDYDGSVQGAFLADEKNGSWGKAISVPGMHALNGGGEATVQSVSCATAGNCSAGGFYFSSDGSHAFVVDEKNGVWGPAIEVPGTEALGSGGANVSSVSCAGAGNCAAGGMYVDATDRWQAFVVDETNGTWGTAIEVPGTATLNSGGRASVNSVSCAAAGTCAAGGTYEDGPDFPTGHERAFVVDETNGTWGNAIELPGTGTPGLAAWVSSISCATAGNCTAGGSYFRSRSEIIVAEETSGSWGNAIEVPGDTALVRDGTADVNSLSCGAHDVCVIGGYYSPNSAPQGAFVAGSGTRPLTVPSAPHLKSAAPGNMEIDVTWSKPVDKGGVPIVGYRATAKAGGHVFPCRTKSKLSCTIAGLKNGTTYTVTVTAENTVGRSKPSIAKTARPRR
jgi:hypothetical protein